MTKFNVGDKVQILDASKISYAIKGGFKTGEVYPVTQINNSGRPVIESKTDHLGFYEHELKYIQKVSDKPTKNQRITALENEVAELKLIVHELRGKKSIEPSTTNTVEDIIEFEGQQYRKVDRQAREGDVVMFTVSNIHYRSKKSYKVIENVKFTDENGQVIHVYNEHKRTPENVDVYELIEGGLNPQIPIVDETIEPLTPNQQRAAIIEKAKKFIENVSSQQSSWTVNEMGNETYRQRCTVNEFIINSEKRTVVVLVKGEDSGKIFEKGIAKCNPIDVFNEHIGKAIALGRALGLDVSEFEQAVQPTEFAVGQVVEANYEDPVWAPFTISELNNKYNEGLKLWDSTDGCFISADKAKIINDTKTNYEEG
ncbi:hypothetical protein [Lysinibacillus sp. GbtcB16]|uniref:hypothetical protein n=1 Tax=Lysinibacillus sp. GbtcB16 TaxID=2824761 RepID=UPI001C310535|nr:hypothetical protein [Lysinibacillus sp. GbtcB16]